MPTVGHRSIKHVELPCEFFAYIEARHNVPRSIAYVTPGLGYIPPFQQILPDYYSPDAAIITDTTGGLTFYINVTDSTPLAPNPLWNITWEEDYWLTIAIPPEFAPLGDWAKGETTGISTSITNDYALIATGKFAADSDIAPNWWEVKISAATQPGHLIQGFLYQPGQNPYRDRQARTGDFIGCYSVSISGLKAPSCAGKYFLQDLRQSRRDCSRVHPVPKLSSSPCER